MHICEEAKKEKGRPQIRTYMKNMMKKINYIR